MAGRMKTMKNNVKTWEVFIGNNERQKWKFAVQLCNMSATTVERKT